MTRTTLPLLLACALLAAHGASAQTATDQARDALAKKDGEGDQSELLKETLTAVDKQYSLIRQGTSQFTYDLTYTYIGQERIVTDYTADGLTLFDIENTNSHTVTNTLSADYGVRNNLTANVTLPLISKYTDTTRHSGMSNSIGDIGIGARWQPIEARRDRPNFTVTSNLRLPSGRSPFKVIAGSGEATGSGVAALSAGLNVNRIVDPVALFGSVNLTASAAANGLHQVNGTRVLTRVKPGTTFGFGVGFAYALSYGISTTLSFQEAISGGAKLRFEDGLEVKTSTQTSGIVSLGLGYRVSPKTTVNLSVGIGLTTDSPNLSVGMNVPLAF
ncbi:outer membrane putative beta-barrel porin/alpha-amylase [Pseudoduganella flava]|uniref:Outer membrane putative beta-barrel porin/alpha-amylase n=1 Tax=Pseudoduganella flava TaxID=871742 RepID=A0A562Q493_9BURK|nr:transporter [Pseudoduganella flava]QGZ41571.1 transporter [Pseudoduganella flava]TWI51552.1 outer membrane putative beta-barrel porin/alpha-amylase [Pseudoduganella flava]